MVLKMAKYIEKEAAVKAVEKYGLTNGAVWGRHTGLAICIASEIAEIPAADVTPVVYGRWGTGRFNLETGNYEEQCTSCRNFSKEYGKPYCPNCGAKMDGGDGNG